MKERPVMPANELKLCPTIGSECLGCPDCPGATSTGLNSGDITNESARQELEYLDESGEDQHG